VNTPFDVYFSADVETDGPIPGTYSMLSFGLAVAGRSDGERFERLDPELHTFYRELRPISDRVDEETLAVSGLDRARLGRSGADPAAAMTEAARFIREAAGDGTPILVAYPLAFDWSWLHWYFVSFSAEGSPFGYSNCLDMKTLFAVRAHRPIALSGASKLPPSLRSSRPHLHHALADAVEQADIFANLVESDMV
jgi:3' exoribonuclease, RNase T-like